jgi:hypothetical protein
MAEAPSLVVLLHTILHHRDNFYLVNFEGRMIGLSFM